MDKFTLPVLKYELRKRQLDCKGVKAVLVQRLRNALDEEGRDPETYLTDFDGLGADDALHTASSDAAHESSHLEMDVRPGDSVSQVGRESSVSHRSGRSCSSAHSVASMRVVEAAKRAELIARASMLKEKRELEERELKLKHDREELALRTELKQADARLKAIMKEEVDLNDEVCDVQTSSSKLLRAEAMMFQPSLTPPGAADLQKPRSQSHVQLQQPGTSGDGAGCNVEGAAVSYPQAGSRGVQHQLDSGCPRFGDTVANDGEAMKALLAQQTRNALPKIEVQKFSGDVSDFIPFMKKFDDLIDSKLDDGEAKLHYLEQFTVGEPREIVKSCLMLPGAAGYIRARELLHRRYGDERRATAVLLDQLLAWPAIKADDARGLDRFAIFLTRCGSLSGESALELNHSSVIRGVMQKLPTPLQDRLRREMVSIQDTDRRVVLDDLVKFVGDEARIALDPLYGKQTVIQPQKSCETAVEKAVRHSCLATGVAEGQLERYRYRCWCCDGKHLLDECSVLREKSADDRRQFLMENHLCFGCLRRGHRVASCKSRKFCNTCKGKHPSVLHEDSQASTKPTEPPCVSMGATTAGDVDIVAGASKLQSVVSDCLQCRRRRCSKTYAACLNP